MSPMFQEQHRLHQCCSLSFQAEVQGLLPTPFKKKKKGGKNPSVVLAYSFSSLLSTVSKDCFCQVSRLIPCLFLLFQVRNEPWNISISAEYIAQVKGVSVEEVIEVTTQNALKLFPKLQRLLPK